MDHDHDDHAETLETIRDHAARALYVSAFADACDAADGDDGDDPDRLETEFRDAYADHPDGAGAGADWMDTTAHHTTPPEAIAAADRIVDEFAATNGRDVVAAFREWMGFDHRYARAEPDAEKFGHYLAMQWLGHGVGLWDDISDGPRYDDRAASGFAVGFGEFGAWDFDAPER